MEPTPHQLCLLIDGLFGLIRSPDPAGAAGSAPLPPAPSGHPVLPIPAEPSTLTWAPERGVRLIPAEAPGGRVAGARDKAADPSAATCTLEPVWFDSSLRLAVLSPAPDNTLRINGQPPPRFGLLSEGDQLLLPGGVLLHVAIYHRPYVGPARPEHVGEKCLVCRTPFSRQSELYACACGRGMHHEELPAPGADEPLRCALTSSECPACQRPVVLEEGFSHVPEVC
jgi:hypothetical protein